MSAVRAEKIRCPVCCAPFDGPRDDPRFDAFFMAHQTCKGQSFDCSCEWERLCGSTTLLARVATACARCTERAPDGSAARCPGCAECGRDPCAT